MEAIRSCQPGT